ncbi:MAG: Uncharacterized protein FD152_2969 [Xanthobacteraceae bacterium]|nr:MAG: Uncharacterized protein FD152_2969 [Xanthobacteraceae bacterium]
MNEIVKPHYPVERLPEDIRKELGDVRHVTLRIEAEPSTARETRADMRARIAAQPGFKPYDSTQEVVDMVRWIRDAEGDPPARWRR